MDSRDYSWIHVTASRVLSTGPCELLYASIAVGASNNKATFYNGVGTNNDIVVILEAQTRTSTPFDPPVPVYCHKGLYVSLSSNVDGLFVLWRELSQGRAKSE